MYVIISELCSACGLCVDICPAEAISPYGTCKITDTLCISCGLCQQSCPSQAIVIRDEIPEKPTDNYNE